MRKHFFRWIFTTEFCGKITRLACYIWQWQQPRKCGKDFLQMVFHYRISYQIIKHQNGHIFINHIQIDLIKWIGSKVEQIRFSDFQARLTVAISATTSPIVLKLWGLKMSHVTPQQWHCTSGIKNIDGLYVPHSCSWLFKLQAKTWWKILDVYPFLQNPAL